MRPEESLKLSPQHYRGDLFIRGEGSIPCCFVGTDGILFLFFGGAPAMAMKPPSPKHWMAREFFGALGVSTSLAEGRGRAPCCHGLMVREGAIAHSPLRVREAESGHGHGRPRGPAEMLACLLTVFLPLR